MAATVVALPNLDRRSYLSRRFTPWTSSSVTSGWSWPQIQGALAAHEQGQFQLSSRLIDSMTRDERIAAHLDTLIGGVLRLPMMMLGPDDLVRTAFSGAYRRSWNEGRAYEWLCSAVMTGLGLAEVVWDTSDPSMWMPVAIHAWSAEHYDIDRVTGFIRLRTQEGVIEIDPNDTSGKWLVLSAGGDRGWLRGAVRSIAQPWHLRQLARRDWARASERQGMGVLKVQVPTGSDDDPLKAVFLDSVANLPNEPAIQVTKDDQGNGYDVNLMEAVRDPGEHYEKLILRCEADIAVRMLGTNASTENSGPYVASSGLFARVTPSRIDGIVGPLEECIRMQLARPFAEVNFGNPDLAAYPDWDSTPEPDKAAQAQMLVSLSQGVAGFKNAGFNVPAAQLVRFGIEVEAATVGDVQFFAYDLEQGTVTINEYRKSKGLPPLPDGDQTVPERDAKLAREAAAPPPEPAPEPVTPTEPEPEPDDK